MCNSCSRKFASEQALWTHAAFKHPAAAATVPRLEIGCRTCGCSFSSERELENHLLQYGTKQLRQLFGRSAKITAGSDDNVGPASDAAVAVTADSSPTASGSLLLSSGGRARPAKSCFECAGCGRKFRDRNALWTHVAFKHPDREIELDADELSPTGQHRARGGGGEASSVTRSPVSLISAGSAVTSKCSVSLDRLSLPAEVAGHVPHLVTNTASTTSNNSNTSNIDNLHNDEFLPLLSAQSTAAAAAAAAAATLSTAITTVYEDSSPSLPSSPSPVSSTALMRSSSSGSLSSRSRSVSSSEESEHHQQQLQPDNGSTEEELQLMTSVVLNDLLGDYAASLELRLAQLQDYFSQLLVDNSCVSAVNTAAAAANEPDINVLSDRSFLPLPMDNTTMVAISAEDIQAMEVGAEVVIVDDSETISPSTLAVMAATSTTVISPTSSSTPSGRRFKQAKKQARLLRSRKEDVDSAAGNHGDAASIIEATGSDLLRARLRF